MRSQPPLPSSFSTERCRLRILLYAGGKPVTFQGQDPLARTLGYIPGVAQAANCTCASVAGRGSDAHTTTCSQQGGTGSTTTRDRNHIVRVRFTHVVTSWAARDDGQAHIEASYHRRGVGWVQRIVRVAPCSTIPLPLVASCTCGLSIGPPRLQVGCKNGAPGAHAWRLVMPNIAILHGTPS